MDFGLEHLPSRDFRSGTSRAILLAADDSFSATLGMESTRTNRRVDMVLDWTVLASRQSIQPTAARGIDWCQVSGIPPASANSYVMSGRGAIGTTDAWVLSRFILWFPVGLLAIAISFTALNYAIVRKTSGCFRIGSRSGRLGHHLARPWPCWLGKPPCYP